MNEECEKGPTVYNPYLELIYLYFFGFFFYIVIKGKVTLF